MSKKVLLIPFILSIALILHAQLPQLSLVQVATGFTAPVDIRNCGDERIFVVERGGQIRIMDKSGNIRSTPFLDIRTRVLSSGGEQGLLSLAFSPNYKQDGYFYVNYINGSGSGSTRISRFSVNPNDSNLAVASSEKILLTFTQPYTNHNGSTLMFGGDGMLYISLGDGGSSGDPQNYAQNKNSLLGKILRLNVSNPDTTYTVPPSNPFVGQANTRPEIWSYGLRNPWRCSFDRITKDYWIADVGQGLFEEISFQPTTSSGGENYGWRCYEGFQTYNSSGCGSSGFTPPVYVYTHAYGGCSVTGGYVYRGTQYSKLWGLYLFTDYCSGRFWSIRRTGTNAFDPDTLQTFLTNQYSTFGEDNNGELYVSGVSNGRIYRVTETSDCKPVAFITFRDTVSGCKLVTLTALKGNALSYQWYNANGVVPNQTDNRFDVTESGWYKVKVSKAQVGCESFSDSVYVIAYDSTAINVQSPALGFCVKDQGFNLPDNINPDGGVFSGMGVLNDSFIVSSSSIGVNQISYRYINNFGCASNASFNIEVYDTAVLQIVVSDSSVCENGDMVELTSFISPGSGIYSGLGVESDTLFNPSSADLGNNRLVYSFQSSEGCISQATINLNVLQLPTLTRNLSVTSYCEDDADISLGGFIQPIGGFYTGPGVQNDTFSPANTGVGEFMIRYDYTDVNGCVNSDTFTLSVNICTAINNESPEYSWSIYPSPNNGKFIAYSYYDNSEWVITDITGKVVYRMFHLQKHTPISLPSGSKGIYLVQIRNDREWNSAKIIVE